LRQLDDVVKHRDTTGGDDPGVGGCGHLTQELDVRAREGAVLGDVRDDETGAAGRVEALEDLPEVTAVGDPAVAAGAPRAVDLPDGDVDGDLLTVGPEHLGDPLRLLQRGGADVDARGAGGQGPLEGGVVADAAGQLHLDVELTGDLRHELVVGAA